MPYVDIPDENLKGVFEPCLFAGTDPTKLIEDALENPIGSGCLETMVKPGMKVLILSDDGSRLTKTWLIMPAVLRRLLGVGVKPQDITIMLAYGTHRAMTAEEKAKKLGADVCAKYRVVDHDWRDAASLVSLGKTESGVEIEVNRAMLDNDFVLAIGQIGPHPLAGWSGGCKMVEPGVCGAKTTDQVHWIGALTTDEVGNLAGVSADGDFEGPDPNPVRREMEEVGLRAGLKAVFNVIHDANGNMAAAVFGHPVKAFRHGVTKARQVLGVPVPRLFDIVVTDSFPADADMWQANKAIRNADLMVRQGGVIILITPCPEGVADHHPEVERYGYMKLEDVKKKVDSGEITDLVAAGNLSTVGRIVRQHAKCLIASPGVSKASAGRLGLIWAPDPSTAVQQAIAMTSPDAEVAVLVHGGEALPLVQRQVVARETK